MQLIREILVTIYCMPIVLTCAITLAAGILVAAAEAYVEQYHKQLLSGINWCLLLLSVIMIIYSTILNRFDSDVSDIFLVPFHTISDMKAEPELIRTSIMNMILFYPLGISCGLKRCEIHQTNKKSFWEFFCFAILLSVGIEVVQYIFSIGQCDIDDLICNAIGAVVGYNIVRLGHPIYNRIVSVREKRSKKAE